MTKTEVLIHKAERKNMRDQKRFAKVMTALMLSAVVASSVLTGCSSTESTGADETQEAAAEIQEAAEDTETEEAEESGEKEAAGPDGRLSAEDIAVSEEYSSDADGGHAIEADGEEASYSGIRVTKTGEADGDEADFYGENAAVFAANGASLTISDAVIDTDGTHANGVFSYGEGTTVNISHSVIVTSGNCSGGLMTTGGGTMNASDLTIETGGRSSAAIRSDRGGGTVNVEGGYYTTSGTGSPVIYSTADITVSDAYMESTASQGVVVEGKNSVTLKDVTLTADNNTKNSDKSDTFQAVMIYQSMSGDADTGTSSFTMEGGSLTNKNGDIFFVNNTACQISLKGAEIVNEDSEGVFLRAQAAGWGTEGSNGGKVILTASGQTIEGDMIVDQVSALNLYLKDQSSYAGAINTEGAAGSVYVEIESGSTWKLTGDSYITALTCGEDAIDLNGYTLYVNGQAYEAGTGSQGEALEIASGSTGHSKVKEHKKSGSEDPAEGSENSSEDKASSEKHSGRKPSGEKPSGKPSRKSSDNASGGSSADATSGSTKAAGDGNA